MKWIKKGLIYGPDGISSWAKNSALQPTPYLLNDDIIRVFVGFRDEKGVGRIGYADVDSRNPSKVLDVSKEPVLDIGLPGCFDDNGVVPCSVLKHDNKLYMYYAGYQIGYHVRMLIFSGLAISRDNGKSFERYSNVPILERTNDETLFRVIHSAIIEDNIWKIYYGAGNRFKQGKNKTLPLYDIRYMESKDGINFPSQGQVILETQGDEYRIGRPYVVKNHENYNMFFCAGTEEITYKLAYAESKNGIDWSRKDQELGIEFSDSDWDSIMMAYPSVISHEDKTYLFYNGNNYGFDGFGYAELEK